MADAIPGAIPLPEQMTVHSGSPAETTGAA